MVDHLCMASLKKDIIKGIGALLKNRNLKVDLGSNSINVGFCPPNDRIKPDLLAGQRGWRFDVLRGTNTPANIGGRSYTGHALDMMQQRGIMPSVVENAIQFGTRTAGNVPGRYVYLSESVQVVVNAVGDIITVIPK